MHNLTSVKSGKRVVGREFRNSISHTLFLNKRRCNKGRKKVRRKEMINPSEGLVEQDGLGGVGSQHPLTQMPSHCVMVQVPWGKQPCLPSSRKMAWQAAAPWPKQPNACFWKVKFSWNPANSFTSILPVVVFMLLTESWGAVTATIWPKIWLSRPLEKAPGGGGCPWSRVYPLLTPAASPKWGWQDKEPSLEQGSGIPR